MKDQTLILTIKYIPTFPASPGILPPLHPPHLLNCSILQSKAMVIPTEQYKLRFNSTLNWQYSEECMCRLRNIAMRDYQESVTTGQTHRQTPDRMIPMCCHASQATQ